MAQSGTIETTALLNGITFDITMGLTVDYSNRLPVSARVIIDEVCKFYRLCNCEKYKQLGIGYEENDKNLIDAIKNNRIKMNLSERFHYIELSSDNCIVTLIHQWSISDGSDEVIAEQLRVHAVYADAEKYNEEEKNYYAGLAKENEELKARLNE